MAIAACAPPAVPASLGFCVDLLFWMIVLGLFQAFNMTGGEKIWLCVHDLKEDIKTLHYASKEDDKRDDDHDGIPDVKQVRVGGRGGAC